MNYIKVRWRHTHRDEPVWLYSEIDDERRETRTVEVFADGRRQYASRTESEGGARLGEVPIPPLSRISDDPQFQPAEIAREEFEEVWAQRRPIPRLIRHLETFVHGEDVSVQWAKNG